VQVEVVEELGADAYIYGSLAQPGAESHQVIARVDGRRPPEKGSTVHFTPKQGHVHLFDHTSGLRIEN
jgi:multiple sugar transport system ATP-binding protein